MSALDINMIRTANSEATAAEVADMLIEIGGIVIGQDDEFTFASGLRSPIYCDNRLFLSRHDLRTAVVQHLVSRVEQIAHAEHDAIAGVASAGIPFAAWVANERKAPMVYVRPAEKEHGRRRRIEGGVPLGARVILVEDLVTTGESALSAVAALRDAGYTCDTLISIVNYGFTATSARFTSERVEQYTLTHAEGILGALRRRGTPENDLERVRAWYRGVNDSAGAQA